MPAKQPAADRLAGFTKADYLAVVATNYKGLADFASRYGVEELHEAPINIANVLPRLHEIIREQAAALRTATRAADAARRMPVHNGNGPSNGHPDPDPLHRLRERHIARADLDLAERRGELVDRELVCDVLDDASVILRRAGERLQRRFGDEAARMYLDAIDRIEERFAERLGDDDGEPPNPKET